MALAEKTINSLLSPDKVSLGIVGKYMHSPLLQDQRLHERHHTKAPPNVVYAQLKFMWASCANFRQVLPEMSCRKPMHKLSGLVYPSLRWPNCQS
jgi:hypothetical protein